MKKSQLERAIECLEHERDVIQLAIDKLKQQQGSPKPAKARKPKPVALAREA